jgi:glucosyl-3-phosphoglycerate synthase
VVRAPLGKGRAVALTLERCDSEYVCFVDADIERSSVNIPRALREAIAAEQLDMVVGDIYWPGELFPYTRLGIYEPLVRELFPEALERTGRHPFSGFRALRPDLPVASLPRGFAVEAYLNVLCATTGRRIGVLDVGVYEGPVRLKPGLGFEVAEAILDLAEEHGRLDPRLRPRWDAWVDRVMAVIDSQPLNGRPDAHYRARLAAAAARPLPASSPVAPLEEAPGNVGFRTRGGPGGYLRARKA